MNYLYDISEKLFEKKIWVLLHGENHGGVAYFLHFMNEKYNYNAHICAYDKTLVNTTFEKEKVVALSDIDVENAYIIILGKEWYRAYENVKPYVQEESICLFMEGWYEAESTCIACGNKGVYQKYAEFYPFVNERMFKGEEKKTGLSYCPECGMTYSTYRPTDEEVSRYYINYRDKEYQQRRQVYEPAYTAEFNEALSNPPDNGADRRKQIVDFVSDSIDVNQIKNILDYGGDRGQFIPHEFRHAKKYVYDISGVTPEDGVIGFSSENDLRNSGIIWDLILCNQCMEHLSDVAAYFSILVSYMSVGSYLYIEVPNERSILNSYTVKIHEHINMFSEETFKKLAKQHQLEVIKSTDKSGVRCLLRK